jgi:hypothetical protein
MSIFARDEGTRGGMGDIGVVAATNPHPNPSPCAQGEGLWAACGEAIR